MSAMVVVGGRREDRACEENGGYRFLGMVEDAPAVEEWVADIAHDGREREREGDGGGRRLRWAGNMVN